jgi:phage terminase small subunit
MAREWTNPEGLTARQIQFVEHYCQFADAQAAAIAAGYSPKSAHVNAIKNLAKPVVSTAVARRRAELQNASQLTMTPAQRRDRIIRELDRIAFGDRRKAYDADGKLKPIRELDEDTAAMIDSVKSFEEYAGSGDNRELVGHVREVKFCSKLNALAALARIEGLDDPKVRVQLEAKKPDGDQACTVTSRIEILTRVAFESVLTIGGDNAGEPGQDGFDADGE